MTAIIDGKQLATEIRERVREDVASLSFVPGLAAVLIGNDPASHLYVTLKEKACAEAGIRFEKILLTETLTEAAALECITSLNSRDDIDAIVVQLPLPPHLSEDRIIAAIHPDKDVDGFHPETLRKLRAGESTIIPGLIDGIVTLLRATKAPLSQKHALVIANSRAFFTPLDIVLRWEGLTTTFLQPSDSTLTNETRTADIIVIAIGQAGFLSADMIKPGAIIIDVGTNRINGKTVGDVDFKSVSAVASYITPVPGGVGPMTVAMLLKNTIALARARRRT